VLTLRSPTWYNGRIASMTCAMRHRSGETMTSRSSPPTIRTTEGIVEGGWEQDVAAFRGIPYARAPVGPRRWAPPAAVEPWKGIRPARAAGPIPPQHPARLEAAMGPMRAPGVSEDCLTLNVWTPDPAGGEALPVVVFLHGGGYLAGAGSAEWYDGRLMARRGPVVVVTINYRLGALGYLYLPPALTGGEPIANLGLQDQRLALEWVSSNIQAFGGDPARITVIGQSGGAHSIVGLQGASRAIGLFQRAVLQSAPLGMPAAPAATAERSTRIFLEELGMSDPTLEDLRALPLTRILEAQRATLARTATPGRLDPPFHLTVDGVVLTEDPIERAADYLGEVDVLLGFTTDEASAFFAFDEPLWQLRADALVASVRERAGDDIAAELQHYVEHADDGPPARALVDMVSDAYMIAPTVELAERLGGGRPVHLYRMGWSSDAVEGRLGACHTIELPFVFNTFEAWSQAPMLGTAEPDELRGLGRRVQDAWLAFAESGVPQHDDLPTWRPCSSGTATALDFDVDPAMLEDPSDGRRELWAPYVPADA
jgi:para-nitrobenzyl esterase